LQVFEAGGYGNIFVGYSESGEVDTSLGCGREVGVVEVREQARVMHEWISQYDSLAQICVEKVYQSFTTYTPNTP
jgi:hypothetical protein